MVAVPAAARSAYDGEAARSGLLDICRGCGELCIQRSAPASVAPLSVRYGMWAGVAKWEQMSPESAPEPARPYIEHRCVFGFGPSSFRWGVV